MEHKQLLELIGSRVKELRKARGWTQAELAERVSITTDFLGKAERGDKEPSLYVLHKLADVLGVSPSFLLSPAGKTSTGLQELTSLLANRSDAELDWLKQFVLFVERNPIQPPSRDLPPKARTRRSPATR